MGVAKGRRGRGGCGTREREGHRWVWHEEEGSAEGEVAKGRGKAEGRWAWHEEQGGRGTGGRGMRKREGPRERGGRGMRKREGRRKRLMIRDTERKKLGRKMHQHCSPWTQQEP